jgi:phosphoribosyl 1,2-cyclic phosphate phosphodiesterase
VIEIRELRDGESVEIGGVSIRPLRLAQDFVYAFLFDDGDRRLLVVMDEIDGWEPPEEARGVDLAIVPKGVADLHPFTGERRIPEEHPALAEEATFGETLEIVKKLDAQRVVMTHIEESDGLGHDDLVQLAERLQNDGLNLTFAFDTQIVEV